MNKKSISILLAATAIGLTACNNDTKITSTTAIAPVLKADAIAEVNGIYISKATLANLEEEITKNSRGQSFPKDKLIEELIQRELLVQEAQNKQLDKSEEVIKQLTTVRNSVLSRAAIQNHLKSNAITDVELKAEYDKGTAQAGSEYKAKHILVKTEDEAKQIIDELNNGSDFAELAKTKSTGPSASKGGDLGWFAEGQMVAPFSEAVVALADNKYTTEPVQTQFGWHVILREGSRAQSLPPFDSVKEQIRPKLQRQIIQDYLESLRSKAKVEILLPPTPPVEKEQSNKENTVGKSLDATTNKVSETADSMDKTAKDAVSKLSQTVEQTKEAAKRKMDNAISETAKKVEQAKETAVKNASKAMDQLSDTTTKTLDSVTQ